MNTNVVIAIATVTYVALTAAVVVFMWLQTRAQRKTARLQMFNLVASRLEEVRQSRQIVRDYVRKSKREHDSVVFPLPDNVRDAADKVCREFDYLGLFDRTGIVDSRMVDQFYAAPFVLLYEDVLKTYVDDLRKPDNRGFTHFWELDQFYRRVKNVPRNHPGIFGKNDWPEDARA